MAQIRMKANKATVLKKVKARDKNGNQTKRKWKRDMRRKIRLLTLCRRRNNDNNYKHENELK